MPAKASRTLRCATGVTSARCSCCPWISTRSAAASPSAPTGAMRPSTQARDRPSAGTARARMTSRSPAPSPTTKRASTRASAAPARTMPTLARPPSTSWSASTTSVLPAPVSPVSAVMPGPKVSVRSSMTPRSRTRRSVSTTSGPGRPGAGSARCRRTSAARCARPARVGGPPGTPRCRRGPAAPHRRRRSPARPERSGRTSTRTSCVSVSTRLRSSEKCGATGVTTMARNVGARMGPPAERLYAVEPVGVAMMSPSAE